MNILILSAMTEEIDYLVKSFNLQSIDKVNGNELYELKQGNMTIYILNSSIGKVNSTITTSMVLNKYPIDKLVSIGTSGALTNSTNIGDFVLGKRLAYHDVDVTGFGYEIGQLPQMDKYFQTTNDQFINNVLTKFKENIDTKLHTGDIVTADKFVCNKEDKEFINKHFEKALCCEMESTAIIHTAISYGIDCYAIRSISDNADSEADVSFDEYLFKVCEQYKKLVDIILNYE